MMEQIVTEFCVFKYFFTASVADPDHAVFKYFFTASVADPDHVDAVLKFNLIRILHFCTFFIQHKNLLITIPK